MLADRPGRAYVAVDACGTFSQTKREVGLLRMLHAGVILSDYASLMMMEILKDNARPEAGEVYGAMDMPWAKLVGQMPAPTELTIYHRLSFFTQVCRRCADAPSRCELNRGLFNNVYCVLSCGKTENDRTKFGTTEGEKEWFSGSLTDTE